jgi:predicted methyltransferase
LLDLDRARLYKRASYLHAMGAALTYRSVAVRRALFDSSRPRLEGLDSALDMIADACGAAAAAGRKSQRPELDQCPVDEASLVRRLRNMASCGDMVGDLLCIGDNDHVSPVIAAGFGLPRIVVVDREPAVLDSLADLNHSLGGTELELHLLDVRDTTAVQTFLSENERRFSLATSDPPYTIAGYVGFLRLAIAALRLGGALHLVAPHMLFEPWSLDLLHDIQTYAVMNGLVVTDLWRSAQTFQVGSGVVSSQIRFERCSLAEREFELHLGNFYTLDQRWG